MKRGKNEKIVQAVKIRLSAIKIRKDEVFANARTLFEQEPLEELKQSVSEVGLLENLAVERDANNPDEFWLLAGERRHIVLNELVRENGIVRVPHSEEYGKAAEVYEFIDAKIEHPKDDIERLKIMFTENMQHSAVPDWDYIRAAVALEAKTNPDGTKKYTRKDLCKIFGGCCEAWLSHTLRLATLPERALACLKNGSLPRSSAIHLFSAKPEEIENILKHAETIIVRERQKALDTAKNDEQNAEMEAECAEAAADVAAGVGNSLRQKIEAKRASGARRKVQGARDRYQKAQEQMQAPITYTEDRVKQALEEKPAALKPGVAPKTRSHKRVREKLKEIKALLDSAGGEEYITSSTGSKYLRTDVRIVYAAYEQFLGKTTLDVFALLDEEYQKRTA